MPSFHISWEHWRSDFHALKYTQRGSSCENWNLWPSLSMSEKRDACFLIREIVRIKKDTESLRSLSGEVANFVFRKEELTVYCHFDGCINSFESSFSLFYNTFLNAVEQLTLHEDIENGHSNRKHWYHRQLILLLFIQFLALNRKQRITKFLVGLQKF